MVFDRELFQVSEQSFIRGSVRDQLSMDPAVSRDNILVSATATVV